MSWKPKKPVYLQESGKNTVGYFSDIELGTDEITLMAPYKLSLKLLFKVKLLETASYFIKFLEQNDQAFENSYKVINVSQPQLTICGSLGFLIDSTV